MTKEPLRCDLCAIEFHSIDDYFKHKWSLVHHIKQSSVDQNVRHACELCSFSADNMVDLASHLDTQEHKTNVEQRLTSLRQGSQPRGPPAPPPGPPYRPPLQNFISNLKGRWRPIRPAVEPQRFQYGSHHPATWNRPQMYSMQHMAPSWLQNRFPSGLPPGGPSGDPWHWQPPHMHQNAPVKYNRYLAEHMPPERRPDFFKQTPWPAPSVVPSRFRAPLPTSDANTVNKIDIFPEISRHLNSTVIPNASTSEIPKVSQEPSVDNELLQLPNNIPVKDGRRKMLKSLMELQRKKLKEVKTNEQPGFLSPRTEPDSTTEPGPSTSSKPNQISSIVKSPPRHQSLSDLMKKATLTKSSISAAAASRRLLAQRFKMFKTVEEKTEAIVEEADAPSDRPDHQTKPGDKMSYKSVVKDGVVRIIPATKSPRDPAEEHHKKDSFAPYVPAHAKLSMKRKLQPEDSVFAKKIRMERILNTFNIKNGSDGTGKTNDSKPKEPSLSLSSVVKEPVQLVRLRLLPDPDLLPKKISHSNLQSADIEASVRSVLESATNRLESPSSLNSTFDPVVIVSPIRPLLSKGEKIRQMKHILQKNVSTYGTASSSEKSRPLKQSEQSSVKVLERIAVGPRRTEKSIPNPEPVQQRNRSDDPVSRIENSISNADLLQGNRSDEPVVLRIESVLPNSEPSRQISRDAGTLLSRAEAKIMEIVENVAESRLNFSEKTRSPTPNSKIYRLIDNQPFEMTSQSTFNAADYMAEHEATLEAQNAIVTDCSESPPSLQKEKTINITRAEQSPQPSPNKDNDFSATCLIKVENDLHLIDLEPDSSVGNVESASTAAQSEETSFDRLKQLWQCCKREKEMKEESRKLGDEVASLKKRLEEIEHLQTHLRANLKECQSVKKRLLDEDGTNNNNASSSSSSGQHNAPTNSIGGMPIHQLEYLGIINTKNPVFKSIESALGLSKK